MRILRKLFTTRPAVEPTLAPLTGGQAEPDLGDDGMGESWVWEPGDLDDEEVDR
ncbi:hypothetical protein ACIQZO_38625 [Streptomyces sp. NPDC097617]|uniref:hypothetical protein n=1 Tax=Streptomyces sp. NPDC097617 TaxID=3366091 RepID=UPI00381EF930